jgi:competence protein ComEC
VFAGTEGRQFRLAENPWQAPLVPVALSGTTGIVIDRTFGLPLLFTLSAALATLAGWAFLRNARRLALPLIFLWTAIAMLGAAYHHIRRDVYPADDIGYYANTEARPVRVRGILVEEPAVIARSPQRDLRSIAATDPTLSVLRVTHLRLQDDWAPVSGRARLITDLPLTEIHVGDSVELVGRLQAPHGPANPGEADSAAVLRDQRIRAQIEVRKTPAAVIRMGEGWQWSPSGWLAVLRDWGQRTLAQAIPGQHGGIAVALILGEGSSMTQEDWDQYKRTGVIHALAISGYHLVILAAFLNLVMRFVPLRRRYAAVGIAVFLVAYALLAGGRPPILRAAVMVCAMTGGLALRRPTMPANTLALSWLVVGLLNPCDLYETGCQLSFLAVALLYFGVRRWFRPDIAGASSNNVVVRWLFPGNDPLERLIDETRPWWQRALIAILRRVAVAYLVTLTIWLAAAPLVAARYHLVAPIGILIGPITMLFTSIALLSGFLVLFFTPICGPLATVFAWITSASIGCCDDLVRFADSLPGGHWYVGDIPVWWLWAFYLVLLGVLLLKPIRQRWRWTVPAGVTWLSIGFLAGSAHPASDEMRCTFLAVGHGGCTVIELPDGRTLLYDAGALGGPDVTRKQIAPFLWHRGIRRIDEVFLSHADLDHFNGLPALLDRFNIGQVTCTPTFADKNTPGVRATLVALEQHHIPIRIVRAGDRLSAGELEMEVLHPPPTGPEGNENARSMVLRLRHAGHTLLLTGDLEGPGLTRVLALPPEPVDVLMAPHHGSPLTNKTPIAEWATPRLAIACQGPPRSAAHKEPYSALGARYLGTWPHGAITIHSTRDGMTVETFQTGERFTLCP